MKNKYVLLANRWWLAVMCLVSVGLSAQGQAPVIQWQRVFETGSSAKVVKAYNGGYGLTISGQVVRLSESGNTIWQTHFPYSSDQLESASNQRASAIVALPDGGFGVLLEGKYQWSLARLDAAGSVVWMKPFVEVANEGGASATRKVTGLIRSIEGGFVVIGNTQFNRNGTRTDLYKFDADGNNTTTVQVADNDDIRPVSVGNQIIQTTDGNYFMVGYAYSTAQLRSLGWAVKLNAQLQITWQNRYDYISSFTDVIPNPYSNQGYIAVGINGNGLGTSTLYLNPDGNGDNTSGTYRPSVSNSTPLIVSNKNGSHEVLDEATQNSGDLRLASFSFTNQLGWTKTFGGSSVEKVTGIITTNDGGYLIVGTTTSTDGDVQGKSTNSLATWVVKVGNPLAMTQPSYNCSTGVITFNTTGGDSSPITYSAPGISRSSATSNTGTVEQGLRNDPKPITITATQNGQTVSYTFDLAGYCGSAVSKHPDIDPLTDLYNATNGPGWTKNTNWLTGNNPCNWWGITCNTSGRVEKLQLDNNNLAGTLPASLGNLTYLSSLYLVNNQLSGSIPASIGNLTALANLFLHTNQLSGPIPASLGNLSELLNLTMSFNQLSGIIPTSLNNLTKLTFIELGNNQLTGSIPENWGNFPNLVGLLLNNNLLTGSIPASIGSKPTLRMLYLNNNQLSGCFSSALSALCSKDVRLSGNAGLPGGGNFVSFCANGVGACTIPTTPPTNNGGTLAMSQPTYNCNTGAITFNTTGGDGSPITFSAPGISRASAISNTGTVEQGLRNDPKPITITATQNGQTSSYMFDFRAYCTNPQPPVTPPTPPVTPPTGNALTLLAPGYDCTTGAITFRSSGGDGTLIEYAAAGITGWTTNPNQFVDRDSRTANDVKPFTLMARQNGVVVTYIWDLKAACGRARLSAGERLSELSVSLLGNPVSDAVTVEVRGVAGQPLTLRLVDLTGHIVESRSVEQAGEVEHQRFALPSSGPGLLLLRASSGSQSQTVKVIRQ